jgi:hypothetical protein
VVVCFVDIGEIVDHHNFNFLLIYFMYVFAFREDGRNMKGNCGKIGL